MPTKADDRLSKLATFGASAAKKQEQSVAPTQRAQAVTTSSDDASADDGIAPASDQVSPSPTMIRNIAFTGEEQKILGSIMDQLRSAGELTPNFSLAVKVGLRLVPAKASPGALRAALNACKAMDGRRKTVKQQKVGKSK